jgi:hypothetical protein
MGKWNQYYGGFTGLVPSTEIWLAGYEDQPSTVEDPILLFGFVQNREMIWNMMRNHWIFGV